MTAPEVVGRIAPDGADGPADTPPQPPPAPKAAPVDKPNRVLPTDRVGFAKQLHLLRAYAVLVGQGRASASNNDVAELVKIHPNTSILAQPFFVENGFIQKVGGPGAYVPAPEVVSFGRAYSWNAETAPQKLAPLVRRTWFGQALTPRLAMGLLDRREAVQVLAEVCNAGPKYTGQLETLLDYLNVSGVIRLDGDTVREGGLTSDSGDGMRTLDMAPANDGGAAGGPPAPRDPPRAPSVSTAFNQGAEGIVAFHIEVRVDMKDFANWRPDRISAFFGGIAQVLAAKAAVETEAGR